MVILDEEEEIPSIMHFVHAQFMTEMNLTHKLVACVVQLTFPQHLPRVNLAHGEEVITLQVMVKALIMVVPQTLRETLLKGVLLQ